MNEYERLKESVKIIDYARRIGLTPVRIGNYYTLREHDSVRINIARNIFIQNSTGIGGSVIDFAICFGGRSLPGAIKELAEMSKLDEFKDEHGFAERKEKDVSKKKELVLPGKALIYKNVFAYLKKTRKIAQEVIMYMVKNHMLYQDSKNNCVFVSYKDGKPVFASKRGTNMYKRFIGDVAGSDYSYGFFIPRMKEGAFKKLIITESVIDALSLMSLGKKTSDYLSLCSATKYRDCLKAHAEKGYDEIIIALDNDNAGRMASVEIKEILLGFGIAKEKIRIILPKDEKDWNDVVKKKGQKNEKEKR